MGFLLGNSEEETKKSIPARWGCYVAIVTFVMSLVSDVIIVYRCDQLIYRNVNMERHLTFCINRDKHVFPKNVHELPELLFDGPNDFDIPYTVEQTIFKYTVPFDSSQFVWRMRQSKLQKLPHTHRESNPRFLSISSNSSEYPVFSASITLVNWCHLSLMLWKTLPHRWKPNWNWLSHKCKQHEEGLLEFLVQRCTHKMDIEEDCL